MPPKSVGKTLALPGAGPPSLTLVDGIDLGRVYRDHAGQVARWAQRLLGPACEVEDVLHEVFLVAHRRWPEFRGDAHVTTWLYAITQKVVLDVRRKRRWRRWLGLGREQAGDIVATAPGPLRALEGRQATVLTYRLLDKLPEAERTALILFELEGLAGEEIAALTGEAIGTIWVRLHRARTRFRKLFVAHQREQEGIERRAELRAQERRQLGTRKADPR
jgi:RNA polymerase sigma-70 factor (ECF subfamily)